MTGDILTFLIEISFTILGAAFLARAWLHARMSLRMGNRPPE